MRSRVLAATAVLGLLGLAVGAPAQAAPDPTVTQNATTCVDGYGVLHLDLAAADATDTTFVIEVHGLSRGEEAKQTVTVPAGTQQAATVPDLLAGMYNLEVFVGSTQVIDRFPHITCTPTHPYTNVAASENGTCGEGDFLALFNEPLEGATALLQPVHFVVTDTRPGGGVIGTADLPKAGPDPYVATIRLPDGIRARYMITGNGDPVRVSAFGGPSCAPDPEEPVADDENRAAALPNTGA